MTLLQPSFRGRLRLFFAVIVVIPMIAVVIVLFQLLDATDSSKLDASLSKAQNAATKLYEAKREDAMAAAGDVQTDVGLATAINDKDAAQVRRRLDQLARRIDAKLIVLEVTGFGRFETGTPTAIAAASGRLLDAEREGRRDDHGQHDRRGGLRARGAATARRPGARRPRRRGAGDDEPDAGERPAADARARRTSRPAAPTIASRGSRPASRTTR